MEVEVLDSVTSTNDYLRERFDPLADNLHDIKIVIANEQTKGKGRLERAWSSPAGENIYCSCQIGFQKKTSELSGLSLIAGLAIVNTLEQFVDNAQKNKLTIKWPNDILYQRAKLSGILIDIAGEHDGVCTVIIGMGININMTIEPDINNLISQPWTSLKKITGKTFDKDQIISVLIDNIIHMADQFEQHGFDCFIEQWNLYDSLQGQTISLKTGNNLVTGIARGVNAQGYLLLELPSGETQSFCSGDVLLC